MKDSSGKYLRMLRLCEANKAKAIENEDINCARYWNSEESEVLEAWIRSLEVQAVGNAESALVIL